MHLQRRLTAISCACRLLAGATLISTFCSAPARAELALDQLLSGVVHIKAHIAPDGRTAETLGHEREGSGIVIDDNGLVLTIGYLMVEAVSAEVVTNDGRTVGAQAVGYDNESGFGLLQATSPLKVRPLQMDAASAVKAGDPVLVASWGGVSALSGVHVVARREFAASWEYLLDEAIFTAPPHPAWSGAALIGHDGKLLGVGSLALSDVSGNGEGQNGNMFVPVAPLMPILADLISSGRRAVSRPWLGLSTDEIEGRLVVARVTPGAPADKAGVKKGDVIVGVNGETPKDLSDFYRKVWALGPAGTVVPLEVLQNPQRRGLLIHSINRLDDLKLNSSF